MPLPSLLQKGKLVPRPGMTPKEVKYIKEQIPIDYIIARLKDKFPEFGAKPATTLNDLVFIIRAKTGSGKSTAMPVEIYRIFNPSVFNIKEYTVEYKTIETEQIGFKGFKEKKKDVSNLITSVQGTYQGKNILCTQPRVLTAMDIPIELTNREENPWAKDMIMGETIGYSTGARKQFCKNCLMYSTLDTLLVQLKSLSNDDICDLYRVIILDEVHERSVTLDIVIMLLKKLLTEKVGDPNCPFVIFTSATFDVEKYAEYLSVDISTNVIDVEGQTYPIEEIFLETDTGDYVKSAAEIIERINNTDDLETGKNDILVFLPGAAWVKQLTALLSPMMERTMASKNPRPFLFVDIKSAGVNNTKVFQFIKNKYDELPVNMSAQYDKDSKIIPHRRIFTGTTVAETGITIATLAYVIDSGYTNMVENYFPYNIGGLATKPIAKSRAKQRRGRVGRKLPGTTYYLYTQKAYNVLQDIQLPDILNEGIGRSITELIHRGYKLNELDMLDVPSVESLKSSISTAIVMGAIDYDTMELTQLGEAFNKCQYLTLDMFRIIRSAYIYNLYIPDICTIIAMNEWMRPYPRKWKPKNIIAKSLPKFFDSDDELFMSITLCQFIEELFVFNAFKNVATSTTITETQEWCENVGLNFTDMIVITKTRADIMNDIATMGLHPLYGAESEMGKATIKNYLDLVCRIKRCLYDGFCMNMINFNRDGFYFTNRYAQRIIVNGIPNSVKKYCNHLITNKIKLTPADFDSFRKSLSVDRFSVLDGYVDFDSHYLSPIIT